MEKLKNQLKNNEFSCFYLFHGEEEYLRDFYANKIAELICPDENVKAFNYMKVNGVKPNNDSLTEFLVNYPFMSDRKVLIIKNSGILKKATDADKTFWKDVFENIYDYATIIFSEVEIDKRGVIYKELSKVADVYEFKYQKESDLVNWVAKVLATENKKMAKQDIEYLLESSDNGMLSLKSELDKLISYAKDRDVITKADVDLLVCKSAESRVFSMIDDLVSGNSKDAYEKLDELKRFKESPVAIISLIARQYTIYRKIKALSNKLSVVDMSKELGIKDFFLKKHVASQKKMSQEYIDSIISLCAKSDSDIKSGKIDGWIAVETIVNKCMTKNK